MRARGAPAAIGIYTNRTACSRARTNLRRPASQQQPSPDDSSEPADPETANSDSFEQRIHNLSSRSTFQPSPSEAEPLPEVPSRFQNLFSGAAEESQKINWPTLPEALGNTAVTVAIVISSSAALTAINAVLSRIAARVF